MNKKWINVIAVIRCVMVGIVLVFAVLLQMGEKNSNTDISIMEQAIASGIDMNAMQKSSNLMIRKYYGLNVNDYEGVVHFAPLTNMDAEEILIVKLKDQSQSGQVEQAIEKRLETQKASFEGYGVEQFELLEKHILNVKGNYIVFVVHPNASAVEQAFLNNF